MAALQCTKEPASDELRADIAGTGQFSDEMFKEFTGLLLTFLTKPNQANRMLSLIETFGEENGINPSALQNITRTWLSFLRAVMKTNSPPKALRDDLIALGLPDDKATFLARVFKKNTVALSRAVVGRTLNVNQLTDMQWRFGVTSGSSETRTSGKTFLQLKLTINDGINSQDEFVELSLPMFFSLMKELQQAKAALDELS